MGLVYLAEGPLGEQVALKTVRAERIHHYAGIRREIESLRSLSHPGIIRIIDHGVGPLGPWYTMPIIEGATLDRHLSPSVPAVAVVPRGAETRPAEALALPLPMDQSSSTASMTLARWSREEGLRLFAELCWVLAYLHGEGLTHRDLSPGNVFVIDEGEGARPVLVDFGLATPRDLVLEREQIKTERRRGGTLSFMATEAILGEPVDARADLNSLGFMS